MSLTEPTGTTEVLKQRTISLRTLRAQMSVANGREISFRIQHSAVEEDKCFFTSGELDSHLFLKGFIMKIYYFENKILKYLFSYLKEYSSVDFELVCLKNTLDVAKIENNEANYIFFSNFLLDDIILMNSFIEVFRFSFKKIRFNIVCGGGAHYCIDNQELRGYYPEIGHVCVGKGENFLVELIEGHLGKGIYFAKQFGRLKRYRVHRDFKLNSPVLITFADNRCDWGKCFFCHQQADHVMPIASAQELADDIDYYTKDCGYTEYIFYDNNLRPDRLQQLLTILYDRGYKDIPIDFDIFGMRVDSGIEILEDILIKWGEMPISQAQWGVEFYNQDILDLYNKNITLAQIDKSIDFFYKFGINNNLNFLLGLPLISSKNIEHLYNYIMDISPKVAVFLTAFFVLSRGVKLFDKQDQFGIRVKNNYTLQDYYFFEENIKPIKTIFVDFDSFDPDTGQYLNRAEVYKKYDKFWDLPKGLSFPRFSFTNKD